MFDLSGLKLIRTRWTLEATDGAGHRLSESALRGACLKNYRRSVCPPSLYNRDCADCAHLDSCSYGQVFAARPANFNALRKNRNIPRPYLFRVLPGPPMAFELTLIGSAAPLLPRFVGIFSSVGRTGIFPAEGEKKVRFRLGPVMISPPGTEPYPFDSSRIVASIISPWIENNSPFTEALITFLSPVSIKDDGKFQSRPHPPAFFRRLRDRLSSLQSAWCDGPPDWDFRMIPELASRIEILEDRCRVVGKTRRSGRTGHIYPQAGFVGRVRWSRIPEELCPLLLAASLVGVGKGCAFGGGRFRVEPEL